MPGTMPRRDKSQTPLWLAPSGPVMPARSRTKVTGSFGSPTVVGSSDILAQLSPDLFFDALAIQVNGPRAWEHDLAVRWYFPDLQTAYRTTLHNGVFTHVKDGSGDVQLTMTVPSAALGGLAAGALEQAVAAGLTMDGDQATLQSLLSVLDPGDPGFNIIEP